MEILGTIIIGLIAGVIAKLLLPGKDPGGCIITILLGIAGALVATYLGKLLGIYEPGETAGFIGAVIGAVIILLLYRMFLKRKS
ncbi:MAG TPA: GlsB/YeaQ/YmgE family stress response membrane protein [Ignavibacteriaceae bacterium]|nr:GlsB/YeaQ/YmgE family stress response membrane protein [Ignavibacteriaceae bacterium]